MNVAQQIEVAGVACEMLGPEYHDGSAAKGWYQYRVRIQTVRVNGRKSATAIGAKYQTRQDAERSAIAAVPATVERLAALLN